MFEKQDQLSACRSPRDRGPGSVFAGAATTRLKRPVSLQMVLRALIDEGLRRAGDRAFWQTSKRSSKRSVESAASWLAPRARGRVGEGAWSTRLDG